MTPTTVAVAVLAIGALGTLVVLLANAASKRRLSDDIAPALRPGYSDAQLETVVIERYMAWGLLLTLFFAVFLPAYWLREPSRIADKQQEEFAQSFVAGEELFIENCAECHGTDGSGGLAVSPYNGEPWPAPNLTTMAQRYAESRTVDDIRGHVVSTIDRGRPGTPMPSWGARYGGPLTDFQIQTLTDWILASQVDEAPEVASVSLSGEELYLQNCARCHGQDLQGVVGPTLVGVFERHDPETVLGILQNGINLAGSGMMMPPWGEESWYLEGSRYSEETLEQIVAYLEAVQPANLDESDALYQTPGLGEPDAEPAPVPEGSEEPAEGASAEPAEDASTEPADDGTEV